MPRPSPTRDRILRFLLGTTARNVQLPLNYAPPVTSRFELSIRADAAHNWVYSTLRVLEENGWIKTEDGLRLLDAPAVYRWWKGVRTRPTVHGLQVAEPHRALNALMHDTKIPVAVTTYYAENVYQGHLFPRRLDCYVRARDVDRARAMLVENLDAKIGGLNFRLMVGDDRLLDESLRMAADSIATDYAPFPQVVLDLMSEGGSCGEAAEMLVEKAYSHAKPRLR